MTEETKQEYVVIKANTLKFELNEVVSLTDAQAATLVNKVRLRDGGIDSGQSKAGRKSKAESDLKELKATHEDLVAEHADLSGKYKAVRQENVRLKAK